MITVAVGMARDEWRRNFSVACNSL